MQIDLKAYTARAKELEAAIYTQKNLMSSQEAIIKNQQPVAPKKKEILPPNKPQAVNTSVNFFVQGDGTVIFICVLLILVGLMGLFLFPSAISRGVTFPCWIAVALGAVGIFLIFCKVQDYKERVEINTEQQKKLKEQQDRYPYLLEKYKEELAVADSDYKKAIDEYNINVSKHNERYLDIVNQHQSMLTTLENTLNEFYSENVIYPKYRNFVAITAINEYLLSGRCDKLEGSDGAYNLYEMELRQNIIIAQLSSIIDNLEQIKSNQYSLYEELQKSNYIIEEILTETQRMKETTKLTAYFAGVTAIAESSPKYYCGIMM